MTALIQVYKYSFRQNVKQCLGWAGGCRCAGHKVGYFNYLPSGRHNGWHVQPFLAYYDEIYFGLDLIKFNYVF